MKNTLVLILLGATMIFVACKKNGMMGNTFGVDTKKYENELSTDYTNALFYHNALGATSPSGKNSVYQLGTINQSVIDTPYYKIMFNRNDSLFSQHFYEFCIDMIQNSGMMGTSDNGMMGNNHGMIGGNGGMMNGGSMGGQVDMNKMISYMDSLHISSEILMDTDYMETDRLIYSQMTVCKMMITQTDNIVTIFSNMQKLRKNHKVFHNN